MGTTAEKLTYLNTTKQNLKAVINTTGAGLTNESTFRSYANVLNDKILGAINGDVDLFEEYPKVSGNGTDLSLNGVVEGKMSITPQGNSSQESTTGKNKIDFTLTERTLNGLTYSCDDTYRLKINGTASASGTAQMNSTITLPAGVYVLQLLFESGNVRGKEQIMLRNVDTDETIAEIAITDNSSKYVRFTLIEETNIRPRAYATAGDLPTFTNAIIKLNVISGSNADYVFEPYTGGIPAPNPDYPFPVNNVTGDNEVVIQSRNLLDLEKYPYSESESILNGATVSIENGIITVDATNATATPTIKSYTPASADRLIIQPGTYYFGVRTNGQLVDGETYTFQQFAEGVRTLEKPYKISQWFFPVATGTTVSKPLLISTDSTNTTYVEHEEQTYPINLGSLELAKIGDYQDYIYYSNGNWYLHKAVGKVVLNGSESGWSTEGGNAPYRINISNALITTSNDELPNVLVNRFTRASYNTSWSAYSSLVVPSTPNYPAALKFRYTAITSLADWKTWLSSNNVTVYYALATPTDTQITDETLISQLNDIYNNAHSYNGVTNITTTYEDGNEQMYLDIEALKDVWEVTE